MIAEALVGYRKVGDGVNAMLRADRTSALVVTSGHGDYYEAVRNEAVFTASNAVAGVAPGTALSTTPPISLYNPPNSGVNLALVKAVVGYVSGTLGAGSLVFAQNTPQAAQPTTGAVLTARNNLIGSPRQALGVAQSGSTLSATPVILRPFSIMGAATAALATFPATAETINDGAIAVMPQAVLCLQGVAAAGTTPLVIFGIVWEEIPQ